MTKRDQKHREQNEIGCEMHHIIFYERGWLDGNVTKSMMM
jgi:hypothetical protein